MATSARTITYTYLLSIAAMFGGLFCGTVTVAGNDYRAVLTWGGLFAIVSAILLGFVVARGSLRWRIAAGIAAPPWLFLVLLLAIRFPFESHFSTALNYLDSQRESLVEAVQSVTASHPAGYKLMPDELPPALAAPGVAIALVGDASVTLVLYHNPDTSTGLRVWINAPGSDYADVATDVPHVYRYSYNNDRPDAPDNRPH